MLGSILEVREEKLNSIDHKYKMFSGKKITIEMSIAQMVFFFKR